jgi:uncharacterized protein (DUF1697 family)
MASTAEATVTGTRIALLRGVNEGRGNRVAMADLRAGLEAAGFSRVRTYLGSGNVLADGEGDLIGAIQAVIEVPVVIRTAEALATVIAENPFPDEARENPKALQVTLGDPIPTAEALSTLASGAERVAVTDAAIYSWHPEGMARSKLALALTPAGATATARNWNTVLTLSELARG